MIPMGDMLNHTSSEECNMDYTWNYETNCYLLVANRNVKRGEELYNMYLDENSQGRSWN